MTNTILEKVRDIAADLFHLPAEKITPQSSPQQIESWDSIAHLNLILSLEAQFDLELAPEDLGDINTIGEIAALVEGRLR